MFYKEIIKGAFPVDTGRKLNVHKTCRRRPGRLLNILCTFNLRPVSTWLAALTQIVAIADIMTMNKQPPEVFHKKGILK